MLLVVAGQLQVYESSLRSGRELTLWVSGDGEAVCVTGLVPRWTRELHLRALEPTLLCRVGREALEEVVRSNPEVGLRLARTLANRLQLMEDRWADMVEKEVSERLAGLLYMLAESVGVMSKEGPMIPTRYTHKQLGSMIGSNREAVTRAFSAVQHLPKLRHIRQTLNTRGFAYATCCALQPLVARQCKRQSYGRVHCYPTAAKPPNNLP